MSETAFTSIALFGANGQIGSAILDALLASSHRFEILAFIPPKTSLSQSDHEAVTVREFDLNTLTREGLAKELSGVGAVVSALNGPALDAQATIQDASADAGVKRFYPSEYGMHHIYRKPGDPMGYIHPAWNQKALANERAVLHPAIRSGKMTFTMIGCGDFYNQDREKVWCPWTQDPSSLKNNKYTIHVIGSPDAEADFTHLSDFATFLVQSLLHPSKSANQFINVVSDTISHAKIAELLEKYSNKKVELDVSGEKVMHEIWEDKGKAPKEWSESAFPVDFWCLVKGTQGRGEFVRPPGSIHNDMFGELKVKTFDDYFRGRFGGEKGATAKI